MSWQKDAIKNLNAIPIKFVSKDQSDFNNICKSTD